MSYSPCAHCMSTYAYANTHINRNNNATSHCFHFECFEGIRPLKRIDPVLISARKRIARDAFVVKTLSGIILIQIRLRRWIIRDRFFAKKRFTVSYRLDCILIINTITGNFINCINSVGMYFADIGLCFTGNRWTARHLYLYLYHTRVCLKRRID